MPSSSSITTTPGQAPAISPLPRNHERTSIRPWNEALGVACHERERVSSRPMALSFGTSGVRGLETELTDEACARFARSFIAYFKTQRPNDELACVLAGDLRRSTPRMMKAIARGLQA